MDEWDSYCCPHIPGMYDKTAQRAEIFSRRVQNPSGRTAFTNYSFARSVSAEVGKYVIWRLAGSTLPPPNKTVDVKLFRWMFELNEKGNQYW